MIAIPAETASPNDASPAEPTGLTVHALAAQRGDRVLFRELSLELKTGQALFVSGVNGAGKTTLLRLLCGLAVALSGEIRWRGRSIRQLREEYRAELLYLGHRNGNKDELSCLENLAVNLGMAGSVLDEATRNGALAEAGLRGLEDLPARFLSQGQQRRLALARLLLTRARLWILDEPFTALDTGAVAWLCRIMERHLASGGLAVFTSHQPVHLDAPVLTLRLGGH